MVVPQNRIFQRWSTIKSKTIITKNSKILPIVEIVLPTQVRHRTRNVQLICQAFLFNLSHFIDILRKETKKISSIYNYKYKRYDHNDVKNTLEQTKKEKNT